MGAGYDGSDYGRGSYSLGGIIGSAFGDSPHPRTGAHEEYREIKKGVFSKVVLIFLFFFSMAFVVAVLVIFYATCAEPVALIGFVGSVVVVELVSLTTIKKTRLGKNDDILKRIELLEKAIKEGRHIEPYRETIGNSEKAAVAAAEAGPGGGTEADSAAE